jgi:hypothetical protein
MEEKPQGVLTAAHKADKVDKNNNCARVQAML